MSIRSRKWEKHKVNLSPVVRRALFVALLLTLSMVAVAQETPAAQPAPAQAPGPEASSSAPEAAAQGSHRRAPPSCSPATSRPRMFRNAPA